MGRRDRHSGESMRIALFTDTFDGINGVATTLHQLAGYAERHLTQLDVFVYAREKWSVEDRGSVRVVRVGPRAPVRIYEDIDFDLGVVHGGLHERFRRSAYDVVHVATPGSMGLNGLLAARRARTPCIGSYHTALPEFARARAQHLAARLRLPADSAGAVTERITRSYVTWFYNKCRLVLAPTETVRADLQRRFTTRVGIFSRGVDPARFHPRFREAHEDIRVLYAGRMSVEKNLDLLVELFHGRSNARLIMVGDGPYRRTLQEKLPNATFTGFLNGQDLSRAYASADIFAFPSEVDTFGVAVLEAMSSELPVVATDRMGPRELIEDGVTGFVAAGARQFRDRLEQLIANPEQRRGMGSKARQRALQRSWSSVFSQLTREYRSVASGG